MQIKVPARRKARIAITIKTTCVTKFISVIEFVNTRSFSFGMKTKIKIKIIGTKIPIALYSSGRLDVRHIRHHVIENSIASIIIKVPTPIPPTLLEFWH